MNLELTTTVGALVTERPARSRVFEKLGIDYCCGGKKSLEQVCREKGIDSASVLELLSAHEATCADEGALDLAGMPLSALADHIVETHHAYLREELPRIHALLERVASRHGQQEPRLVEMQPVFNALAAELTAHMMKEERVLFPAVCVVEQGSTDYAFPFPSIAHPIQAMESEHDDTNHGLQRLRELSDDFTPPDWACNSYRALFDALAELEQDLHRHIHKENHVLFPRALERERTLQGA